MIETLKITGAVWRDLPIEKRDALVKKLRPNPIPQRLLLDMSEIARLDSWGEDQLSYLILDVIETGKVAAIIPPPPKDSSFLWFKFLFKEKPTKFQLFDSCQKAKIWLEAS